MVEGSFLCKVVSERMLLSIDRGFVIVLAKKKGTVIILHLVECNATHLDLWGAVRNC